MTVLNARSGAVLETGNRLIAAYNRALAMYGKNIGAVGVARNAHLQHRFDSVVREIKAAPRADSASYRTDAFSPNAALHMARDLDHKYAEVLRETFPANNAFTLFPLDSSVPVGARTHTVRRIYEDGEAVVYRAGVQIPRVGISQQEEQFPVRHYASSFVVDLFELMSSQFANFAEPAEKLRVCRDVVMKFANLKTWYGDVVNGIYGVLNYPWLAKKVVQTAFVPGADVDAVLAELNALANYPTENSFATMRPDTVVTSPRVYNYLANTRIGDAVDNTLLAFWLKTNSLGISKIEQAWELQGVGPGGTDGMLFYRRDRMGITNVVPQGFTTLPTQHQGFEDITYAWMSHGGVIMREVGNNILGWIDATP